MRSLLACALAALVSGCAYFTEMFDDPKTLTVTELERMPSCGAGRGPEPKIHYFESAAAVNGWQRSRNIPPTPIDAVVEGPFALVELGERGVQGYGLLISRKAQLHLHKRLVLESTFFYGAQIGGKRTEESPCVLLALPPRHYNVIEMYDQEGVLRARTDTERGMMAVNPSALVAPEAPPPPAATQEEPPAESPPATPNEEATPEPAPEQNNEEEKQ